MPQASREEETSFDYRNSYESNKPQTAKIQMKYKKQNCVEPVSIFAYNLKQRRGSVKTKVEDIQR